MENIRAWIYCVWTMTILAMFKLAYIFLNTYRGTQLSSGDWPFNSYLYPQFHRFTDWLIALAWSKETNPWDINNPLAQHIPPSPYGPLTFDILRVLGAAGGVLSFSLLILVYLLINFKIYGKTVHLSNDSNNNHNRLLSNFIFTVFLLVFYPLHFLIDRGNADIIGAVFISFIVYLVIFNFQSLYANSRYTWRKFALDFFIVCLVTSKPSWIPALIFVFFYGSIIRASLVVTAAIAIYMYPIVFQGVHFIDYVNNAKLAYSIVGATNAGVSFSHNMLSAIKVLIYYLPFGDKPISDSELSSIGNSVNIFVLIVGFIFLSVTLFVAYIRRKNIALNDKWAFDFLLLTHVLLCIVLFNNPSPDYRLTIILPIFAGLLLVRENAIVSSNNLSLRRAFVFLPVAIGIISSWSNIFTGPLSFSMFVPVRGILLIAVDLIVVGLLFSTPNKMTCTPAVEKALKN